MRLVLLVSVVLIALSGSVQAQHYGADGSPSVVDGSIEGRLSTLETTVQVLTQENAALKTKVQQLETQLSNTAAFTKSGARWTLAAGTNEVVIQGGVIRLEGATSVNARAGTVDLLARSTVSLNGSILLNGAQFAGSK